MIQLITVKEGQNLYDVAAQYLGDLSAVQHLLDQNGLGYNNELFARQQLEYNTAEVVSAKLVEYYRSQNITIATGTSPQIVETPGPIFFNNPFAFNITDVKATINLKANKRCILHWAFFNGETAPDQAAIKAGTGAIVSDNTVLDAQELYSQVLTGLTAETQYTYAVYLEDFNTISKTSEPAYEVFSTLSTAAAQPDIFSDEFDQNFE